jgi:predicted house-cleaning noncanonical NTP pyrophosphatase (MazG superfamily)
MIKTDNLQDVENAAKYGRIEETRSGNYELVFPSKLNEEIKRFMGSKDFE